MSRYHDGHGEERDNRTRLLYRRELSPRRDNKKMWKSGKVELVCIPFIKIKNIIALQKKSKNSHFHTYEIKYYAVYYNTKTKHRQWSGLIITRKNPLDQITSVSRYHDGHGEGEVNPTRPVPRREL